jgi:hypothetical protein
MGELSKILRSGSGNRLLFRCPGCETVHQIQYGEGTGPRWLWNGNVEKPTFNPSVLVRWNEPNDDPALFDDESRDIPKICHSFVRDGQFHFLDDCTHGLAGKIVDIPEFRY